ncbi:MAG: NAD(P)H-hydrate dehydratase [Candidatus Micrarchaeota archaeon]
MALRNPWSHKYDFGHLLIVGGNWKYSGSPGFNALAALRSGVDLATVAAPERAANIVATFSPDMITVPLKGDYLSIKHVPQLLDIIKNEKVTAVVIGGGMGRQKESFEAVEMLHSAADVPFVFDADAIHAIAATEIKLRSHDVITPHAGEFQALTGIKPSEEQATRIKQAEVAARQLGCVILLKGYIDIVTDGKKTEIVRKNRFAVYMTKGGTGDVLTGIVGSLLAQKIPSFQAALQAAEINGKSGEVAGKEKKAGMLASDLLELIPRFLK